MFCALDRPRLSILPCLLVLLLAHGAQARQAEFDPGPRPGMLIMAHGGTPEWDAAVRDVVRSLGDGIPVTVAFGMADPATLQEAVGRLQEQDVTSIGVVRLFVSGASFLHETEYAFGLRADAPMAGHAHHGMEAPRRLDINVPVALSEEGLLDASPLADVLARRAVDLSLLPERESVLILGHGPASDEENAVWLARMDALADGVRAAAGFTEVRVETLREDWTGKRAEAEARIRDFVSAETSAGRTVIVLPFRLYGFGPYGEVLDGLDYRADGRGLLPSPEIRAWIVEQFDCVVENASCDRRLRLAEP